jgi:D-alanyl-D-alanine carboxypeptidase (penicillin-binding protein 5/6)
MYDYAIGVKTGVTNLAGPSFMGAANKDGRELYAVVLDSADEYARFQDAENMFEWAYDHFVEFPLAYSDEWTTMRLEGSSKEVPVIAEIAHLEWIDRTVKATLKDPDTTIEIFDLEGNVSQEVELDELHGTVNAGDKVGSIKFKQQNRVIAEQDLVACDRVEAPNPIDTIMIWWQRTTQGLDGDRAHAASQVYNVMPIISNNKSSAA